MSFGGVGGELLVLYGLIARNNYNSAVYLTGTVDKVEKTNIPTSENQNLPIGKKEVPRPPSRAPGTEG